MAQTADNSGVGVVLGILVAVLLVIGAYFVFAGGNGPFRSTTTNTTVDLPDVNVVTPAPAK